MELRISFTVKVTEEDRDDIYTVLGSSTNAAIRAHLEKMGRQCYEDLLDSCDSCVDS